MVEKEIKKFFDFIFNEDVVVKEDDESEYLKNDEKVFSVSFSKLTAKRDAIINMGRLKRVLNFYLDYNNIKHGQFKINVKE